ncbi:MAG TPA: metal-dependent hydrolase, partial [Desulfotomaculum sp.]|nr:metal-dependent hydrolase [Desulfotomaculum sp.]
MLFFGHTGTTLGLLWLLNKIIFKEKQLDYRLAFLGSILPDIIDKPLGLILLRYNLGDGRAFAHTLIFPILLFIIGLYITRRKEGSPFLLSACVA